MMNTISRLAALILILGLPLAPTATWGETTSASATSTSRSSSTPSTFAIKQHYLSQQQARIQGDIREATRCIANASNPQALRDFQGNINRTPQTDLNNCSRRLQQLTRQLAELARSAEVLTRDAEAAGIRLEGLSRDATRQKRVKSSNPFSSSN